MNLETRTERLTNNVVCICETVCNQHEICIQMLEGKEYQTLYKVRKKEQRITRVGEVIDRQIMELTPMLNPTSADRRRLLASSHIAYELIHIKDNARTVADFANRCTDAAARQYAWEMETLLVDALRDAAAAYQKPSAQLLDDIEELLLKTEEQLAGFRENVPSSELKQSLIESVALTLQCIRRICEQINYLYTGTTMDRQETRS